MAGLLTLGEGNKYLGSFHQMAAHFPVSHLFEVGCKPDRRITLDPALVIFEAQAASALVRLPFWQKQFEI